VSAIVDKPIFGVAIVVPVVFARTFLAGLRQAIASMALLGAAFSALGQNGLQSNPTVLNPAPTDSSVALSNRAAKKETYAAAMTAVRSDLKPPATMVELTIDFARDRDPEVRSLAIGALCASALSKACSHWRKSNLTSSASPGAALRIILNSTGPRNAKRGLVDAMSSRTGSMEQIAQSQQTPSSNLPTSSRLSQTASEEFSEKRIQAEQVFCLSLLHFYCTAQKTLENQWSG